MTLFAALLLCAGTNAQSVATNGRTTKTLVAYFSWGGNTQHVAERIASLTGGTLFRIEPEKPYPAEYKPCTEVAKAEKEADARPAIKSKVESWEQYDTVFIGCPVWWWTAPMIINTFAESYDFRGKTVVPFCTYAATYRDETLARIRELTPAAEHLKGFGTTGKDTNGVESWLRTNNVIRRIVLKTAGLAVVVRTIASSFRIYFYFCI